MAPAQTWYGTVSTAWNNPVNWTPSWDLPNNVQSVPGPGANVIVPAGCANYPTINNSVSIGSLTLNQGSGSVTVAGGTLSVTSGGISVLSGSSFTINAGASVTSSAGVTAGGTWIVNGTLTASVAMYNTVSFTINSGGVVNASSGGLNANDNGGNLYIYGTLNDGANAISDNANITVSGGSLTAGNITLNAGGLTVTSGTLTAGGFTFYNGGNLTISGASTVTSSGAWTYDGGGYSISGGNFTFSGGAVTLPSGTFSSLNLSGAGTATLASSTTINGNLNLASGTVASLGSSLNVPVGSLTLAGTGQANGTWGATASRATNKNGTYFSGTGILTVTTNAALQNTTTTLAALTPSTYGNSVTFTATVAPSPSGGMVQFQTNGVAFGGPVTVSSGTATLASSALRAGSYTVTAIYNGTATFGSSTSATASQVVNKAAVTIAAGISAGNKAYDGTTAATISSNNVVLGGVLAGDTASVALATNGWTAAFASATAGNGIAVTVLGLTLTGASAANYTLTQPAGLTANITPFPVTVASGLTVNNKVYNGTTAAVLSVNNPVLGGVLPADTAKVALSASGSTAAFASASVGNGVAVTVTGLTLTGTAAANYTLTQPAGLTANLTPASVTITSGITANNKAYDGTVTAAVSVNNPVLSGVLLADTAKVSLSTIGSTATFASASVGSGVAVTVTGLTLTGSAAANYTLTQPAGLTASITTAPVTIASGLTAIGKVYDGTTTAALSLNNPVLNGILAVDAANVKLSTNGYMAAFSTATVGASLPVTVTGLTLSGSAAANYALTQPASLTASITAAPVTIASGLTANNKPYDGTIAATLTVNNIALKGVVVADTANVSLSTNGYTAAFASAAPGLGLSVTVSGLTLTGSAAANYRLSQPVGVTANITRTILAISSPVNTQTIVSNSPTVSVTGTTAGNISVATVWLNVNGGSWVPAVSTTGYSNWTAAVPAPAGADTLQAYAVDTAGNHSVTNSLAFTIIHTGQLTLTTNGNGTFSPAYTGQSLDIGQPYTVTATAQYGWMFTNWTSNLLPAASSASLNFTMASNLVLTANFVYTNYPLLAITAPTNGQTWISNSALVKVTGTASGNVPLSTVWLSVNGGAWTNAVSTNGWRNWSSLVPVAAGSQVLSAYAADTAGYHSLTNTVDFTIIHTTRMTVRTNGYGTVWTNYDTLPLEIGVNYNMLATARNGWTFTNWTSNLLPATNSVVTNSPNIVFTMESNLVLTANFVDLSRPALTMSVLPKGQTLVTNEAPLLITGTTTRAADSSAVTGVWLSFNGNPWQSAASANNLTNWTATLTPSPGLQSVRAYATDAMGNVSLTNTFSFTCLQSFPLVVRTNQIGTGLGIISPNYNGQSLLAGTNFVMKAQAQTGSVFVSWTSNLLPSTNSPTLTFAMASNLVLYANFRDIAPPTLAVTSPSNGQVLATSPLALRGVAADNVAVAQVWYAVNASAWQLAAGTTNWTASIPLVPGTNVIQTYALDTASNASPTNTLRVMYAVAGTLTLRTNGLGTIAQPAGPYLIGQNYTLTAWPAKGFAFTNWTGNPVAGTNAAALQFTMVPNLALTATFVDTQNPTVTITSPTAGILTSASVTVTGKASDNWDVGAVYCQLNRGAWQLAGATTGNTNWSLALNLPSGTNVIRACAADISGAEPFGVTHYSPTNSVTVVFQAAPASLANLRAVITPDDGSEPFEADFGTNLFSQYDWSTNNANDAGSYAYTSPDAATGILTLNSTALPQNSGVQTFQLNFTNRYIAAFSYTNGSGRLVTASAAFSAITNVIPATLAGQTAIRVNALGVMATWDFLANGLAVETTGALLQTNAWTQQNYGPCGAVLILSGGGRTNWNLLHFETPLVAEYVTAGSDGTVDAGLAGLVQTNYGGNAPNTAAVVNGDVLLANHGATLTTVYLNAGAFALFTSDDSQTGAGAYSYTRLSANVGQFTLKFSGAQTGVTVTNAVQFYNPNFGLITNAAAATGVLLH